MNSQSPEPYLSENLVDGVLTLRLGAAPAHALSRGMIAALQDRLAAAAEDSDIRVLLLYGEGRIFCAGHDLKEIRQHRADPDQGRAYVEDLFHACSDMMVQLARMPKPTIAVVEGVATAGGLQLMCACDMTFAAETARFCLPGVNNGGFCTTPAVSVGRKIARNHVMELSLSGEMFDADWALRTGLVNRVCSAGTLLLEAQTFAKTLATRHAPAIATGKETLYRQLELPLEQAYAEATEVMIGHFMDPHRVALETESS